MLRPATYDLRATLPGFQAFDKAGIAVRAGEVFALEFELTSLPPPDLHPNCAVRRSPRFARCRMPSRLRSPVKPCRFSRRLLTIRYSPDAESLGVRFSRLSPLSPARRRSLCERPLVRSVQSEQAQGRLSRSSATDVPESRLHQRYVSSMAAASGSQRRRYVAMPTARNFFGKFGQFFLNENLAFSLDLFHGDTSFRPVDWRIKITPEVNVNYLAVQENGIVNVDRAQGNHAAGHARRPAGSVRRSEAGGSEHALRLRFRPRRNPVLQQRFPRLHFLRPGTGPADLRQPAIPIAINTTWRISRCSKRTPTAA